MLCSFHPKYVEGTGQVLRCAMTLRPHLVIELMLLLLMMMIRNRHMLFQKRIRRVTCICFFCDWLTDLSKPFLALCFWLAIVNHSIFKYMWLHFVYFIYVFFGVDCYELYQKGNNRNGAYKIKPAGFKKFIEVFCDMKCGGWTVIQRRQGGTTNFFRDWNMYKKGFGGGYYWVIIVIISKWC